MIEVSQLGVVLRTVPCNSSTSKTIWDRFHWAGTFRGRSSKLLSLSQNNKAEHCIQIKCIHLQVHTPTELFRSAQQSIGKSFIHYNYASSVPISIHHDSSNHSRPHTCHTYHSSRVRMNHQVLGDLGQISYWELRAFESVDFPAGAVSSSSLHMLFRLHWSLGKLARYYVHADYTFLGLLKSDQ